MNLNKDLADIFTSIDELAERGGITRNRAFAAWFAINFFYQDEDEALEAAASDGGNDQGIDIAFADDNNQEIVIIQAYFPERHDKKTPKNKWDAITASLPFVNDPRKLAKTRPDLAETLTNVRDAHPDYSVAAGLISMGLRSPEIDDSVTAHQEDPKNGETNFFFVPQEDIVSRYKTLVSTERGIPEGALNFNGGHIEDRGEYGRAWFGSVSAVELQRIKK
jgi:hypothetical protein